MWHRGYLFNVSLPFPLNYSPPILVQIWDFDQQNNHNKKNDFLGFTYISIKDLFRQQLDIINDLKPTWYPLYLMDKKNKTYN